MIFLTVLALFFALTPAMASEHSITAGSVNLFGTNGVHIQYEWGNGNNNKTSFIGFATASGYNSTQNGDCTFTALDFGKRFYKDNTMDGFYWGFLGALYMMKGTWYEFGGSENQTYGSIGTDLIGGYKKVFGDNKGFSLDIGGRAGLLNLGLGTEYGYYVRLGYSW
jgi:hypothetical protein